MKRKKITGMLVLNKATIVNLDSPSLKRINGGTGAECLTSISLKLTSYIVYCPSWAYTQCEK